MLILSITQAITDALRSLMLSICEIVYWLIKFFFEIFQLLGTASLLNNDTIQEVYRRIGLILGLFMLFRLVFSTIQYVINPDLLLDKSKGAFNIVKRMIIVVVLLGITPFLFNFAFDFQELIVTEKVIPKLITGKSSGSSDEFGGDLAWYTFSTFFTKNEYADENFCPELTATGSYGSFMEKEFMQNGTLRTAFNCVNQTKDIDVNGEKTTVYLMEFKGYGLLAVLVGCLILWLIIIYTIQVGVRVIQLAYLQLIAPIPIMMYLDPKGDDKLKKWFGQCTTTYLDFFIRTAIMYLVVFVIDLLISGTDDNHFLNSIGNPGGIKGTYIIIIMIIALLIFAKKAPALFKEIFPSSGGAAKFDMGISPKKVFNDSFVAGAMGTVGGAIGAGTSNAIHGFMSAKKAFSKDGVGAGFKALGKGTLSTVGGVFGGAKAGIKSKNLGDVSKAVKVANSNREKRELKIQAGYHWYDAATDKVLSFAGETTGAEAKIKEAQRQQQVLESSKSALWKSAEDDVKSGNLSFESYQFLRGLHQGELKGKKVWLDGDGNIFANNDNELTNNLRTKITNNSGRIINKQYDSTVKQSSVVDGQIKAQGKIIKGLEVAKRDTKK